MIDLFSLLKETSAYKTIIGEKRAQRLSHAYLFLTPDGDTLREYLKIFACAIACDEIQPCLNCRKCNLVLEEKFSDVVIYPKDGDTITFGGDIVNANGILINSKNLVIEIEVCGKSRNGVVYLSF